MKKKTEKYVTDKTFKKTFNAFEERFESSARATAKSFTDQAEILSIILKEVKINNEENKYFRQSISILDMNDFSYDRKLENLTIRVEKLEKAK